MDYKYYGDIDDTRNTYLDLKKYYKMNNYITDMINSCNKEEIVKLLPELKKEDNWYGCSEQIFNFIYGESSLNEYTFYLLHKKHVKPEKLQPNVIKGMLKNTNWGLEYVFHNLERIVNRKKEYDSSEIIGIIIQHIKDDKNLYNKFYKKVLLLSNSMIREKFISKSLSSGIELTDDVLLKSFYKNADEYEYPQEHLPFFEEEPELITSKLPYLLMYYAKKENNPKPSLISFPLFQDENKNNKLNDFIYDNFEVLFKVEEKRKMELLDYVMNNLSKEVLTYYRELFRVYKNLKTSDIDNILSIIVNYNKDYFLLDFIKDREISYLNSGTTTRVFRVGDKVIKFSQKKHFIDTEEDLFLLAPTEKEVLYDKDNNPVLIIEIQDYLAKTYNGASMSSEDIINFMDELEKQGYVTTDPNCLNFSDDNFGFLKSYKDAACENPEDLPEWFKQRPIVMYDIDLVYKKDYPNKKHFKCF